ncbi:MAG TPA: hypothetical protein PKV97_01790 [Thauera aminoaromatica]|nr:hypothetical protein [Thauera aminoaromatica]
MQTARKMVLLRGDQREWLAKFPWAGCKMVRACIDAGRVLFELGFWKGKDFDLDRLREKLVKK